MEIFTFYYPILAISTIYMLWVLARSLPEPQELFRVSGARPEAALVGLLILAVVMVLSSKIVGMSKPLISKTRSAEPAQQPLKGVMFRRVG
jgi:hypothetical protein